jgi:hypothetical protein
MSKPTPRATYSKRKYGTAPEPACALARWRFLPNENNTNSKRVKLDDAAFSTAPTSSKPYVSRSAKSKPLKRPSQPQQMHLNFGFSRRDCKDCGMSYDRTCPQDIQLHKRHHARSLCIVLSLPSDCPLSVKQTCCKDGKAVDVYCLTGKHLASKNARVLKVHDLAHT